MVIHSDIAERNARSNDQADPQQPNPQPGIDEEEEAAYFLPIWPPTEPAPQVGDPLRGLSYAPGFRDALQPGAFGPFNRFYTFPLLIEVEPNAQQLRDSDTVLIPDLESAEEDANFFGITAGIARSRVDSPGGMAWGWFVEGDVVRSAWGRVVGVFEHARIPWVENHYESEGEGETQEGGEIGVEDGDGAPSEASTAVVTGIFAYADSDGNATKNAGNGSPAANGDANGDAEMTDAETTASPLSDGDRYRGDRALWNYRDRANMALPR
ncbi:uncharacterized protein BDV17DRAFT_288415 [Aspergillus undulatus]|uniref:uncharacterized protein n=1 Tax=Aspergillus undulatus TaxID=1810928 RepID=UPI003CCD2AB7